MKLNYAAPLTMQNGITRDDPKPKLYQYAELSRLASDIADKRFADAPILCIMELLNRQKPSTSAASAQKLLLTLYGG